jgi:dienelactone hydrolase/Tol biopolymer transport system component
VAAQGDRPLTEAAWKQRFRAPRFGFPQWARERPERIIYGANHEGTFEVYALDLATGVERRLTSRKEGTGYRVPPRIDPQGNEVWWWDDEGGSELGVWRAQPFEAGAARIATDLGPAYSANTALGTGFALVGRSGGDGTTIDLVAEGGSRRLYAHRESAQLGALSTDEELFVLSHSEHGDARNRAIRILDRRGTTVAELWDGRGRGLRPTRWSPVAGDQRVLIGHERAGTWRPLILDTRAKTEQLIDVDLPGEIEPSWYPDARALLLRHDHRGRGELYRYDLGRKTLARLDTPPGSIDWAAVRPDGAVWLALSTSETPRALVTLDGGRILPRVTGDVPAGHRYRDVVAGDVHGFVATPDGAGPHPILFSIHGGPEAHDEDTFSATVQAWVDHGWAVAMVNYRGSTGYGRAWRDAITGKPGLTELADIAAIHDKLIADGVADPKRSILSGASWGGYLTLLGLGTQPERWSAGIATVPIGDYVAAFEDEMEPLKRYDAALFGGTPEADPEAYRVANPITYIDRVKAPLLITVGRNDPRCPARSVDVYTARLRELGIPFSEYRYDAGHGSVVVAEQIKQLALQLDFAATHFGMTPALA